MLLLGLGDVNGIPDILWQFPIIGIFPVLDRRRILLIVVAGLLRVRGRRRVFWRRFAGMGFLLQKDGGKGVIFTDVHLSPLRIIELHYFTYGLLKSLFQQVILTLLSIFVVLVRCLAIRDNYHFLDFWRQSVIIFLPVAVLNSFCKKLLIHLIDII